MVQEGFYAFNDRYLVYIYNVSSRSHGYDCLSYGKIRSEQWDKDWIAFNDEEDIEDNNEIAFSNNIQSITDKFGIRERRIVISDFLGYGKII